MSRYKTLATMRATMVICSGMVLSPGMLPQSIPSQTANSFQGFFDQLATAQGVGGSRGDVEYMKLVDSIGTMTPAEISTGIPVLDRQLDNSVQPEDPLAKADAALLLMYISWRPDGAELLASQMELLTSMLNDPSHVLSAPAAAALQHIGLRRPDIVTPILEAALKAPDVNNKTGVGPGIAGILLRITPSSTQIANEIVQYMRRPDLTDEQLAKTIVGINSNRVIPDALSAELVRSLERPNLNIKSRALVGIAKSTPEAKDAARARLQRMANDPRETAHVRRLATEALEGQITEDPNPPR